MAKAIESIISLMAMVMGAQHQEMELISELNNYFNFDHNIFWLHSSAHIAHFVDTSQRGQLPPKSLSIFQNATDLRTVKLSSKNALLIVAPETSKPESNINVLGEILRLQQSQSGLHVGYFFKNFPLQDDLYKFFEKCWRSGILNIFASFFTYPRDSQGLLNVFTYNPFGRFALINVTSRQCNCRSIDKVFLKQNSNFQQNRIVFSQYDNFPSSKMLWTTVLSVMNASIITSNRTMLKDGISVIPSLYYIGKPINITLYPIKAMTWLMLVPQALPYPQFSAYLHTIMSDIFFVYTTVTIIGVMLLLIYCRYVKDQKILLFESVADVLNLLMNDNGFIKYQQLSHIEMLLICPLTFVGFVFVNDILSNLQSYLTQPVIQPQINTFDDLYRSPFPICIEKGISQKRLIDVLKVISNHTDWRGKMLEMSYEQIEEHRNNFNKSISFIADEATANALLSVQKQLNIRGYHVVQILIEKNLDHFPVNKAFPFAERLNDIVHRIRSAGLYEKWEKEDNNFNVTTLLKRHLEILRNNEESDDIDRFPFPMIVVYGWISSVIAFVMEIIKWNYRFSRLKKTFFNKLRQFSSVLAEKKLYFKRIVQETILRLRNIVLKCFARLIRFRNVCSLSKQNKKV